MRTILLVEPHDDMRGALESTLSGLGHRVNCTRSGREAADWSRGCSDAVHLLITEVELPDFSGAFLADHLVAIWPDLIVLLTAWHPLEHLRAQGHDMRDLPFLKKPVRLRDIEKEIERLLT